MAFSLDIRGRPARRWPFGARLRAAVQRVDVGFLANGVAFQAFTALLPLLAASFVVVAAVAGDALADQVLALTAGLLPEEGRRLLAAAVTSELQTASASVVSAVVLVWGALNLFKGLDTAFSVIYRTRAENSLVEQTRDALVVFSALLVALTAAVVAGSASFLARVPFLEVLSPLALLVALIGVFLPMYVIFPDASVTAREAFPGATVAAVGWTILLSLFGLYVAFAAGEGGGAVGAVLLLLTWLYFGSFLLLLGAVVNATLAGVGEEGSPGPVRAPE